MTNNQSLKKFLAIFIGLVLFVLIVFFSFKIFGTQASDYEPRDVVVSNIEKNSAKIIWSTGVETQAVVEYGTSPTALNFFAPEATKSKNHSVDLTLLSPSTTYYFAIRIGDKRYDNGGVPWSFTTKGTEKSISNTTPTPSVSQDNTIKPSPTPFQSLKIPDNQSLPTSTPIIQKCEETDCQKIKEKLGKGCTTQDYFICLKKLTPTQGQ
ncbi:MAG: fibronectin type III domain-containing protein [Microgenomates group bacterium]